MQNNQIAVLLEKIKILMISAFHIKSNREKDFSNKSIKETNYILLHNDLIDSKTFWIISIYFFLSVTLLTGVHMYEFLKCFLC